MRLIFALISAVLVLAVPLAHAVDVVAHRGYSCPELENSVYSVEQAWLAGADGVEIDVRVSADGIAFVFHDDEILGARVSGLSYQEVVALNDRPVFRLSKMLQVTAAKGYFVLDLKTQSVSDIDSILDVVRASRIPETMISFQSESIKSLSHIRSVMPGVKLTYLSHLKWIVPYIIHPSAKKLVKELRGQTIDRVSIKGRSFLDGKFIDTIKASGREVHVWTINDPERAEHYRTLGVDGLITDEVAALRNNPDRAKTDRCLSYTASFNHPPKLTMERL